MDFRIKIHLRSLQEPVNDGYQTLDEAKAAMGRIQEDVTNMAGVGAVTTSSRMVTFETKDFIAAKIDGKTESLENVRTQVGVGLRANNPITITNLPPPGLENANIIVQLYVYITVHNYSNLPLTLEGLDADVRLGQPWCKGSARRGTVIPRNSATDIFFEIQLGDTQQRFAWAHMKHGILRPIT